MLDIRGVGKVFDAPGNRHCALSDISLSASPGDTVGIVGPNGAGKTTLLRIITTALKPTSGSGSVCGFDLGTQPAMVRRQIGYISGEFPLYNRLTGREYLRYFGQLNRMTRKHLEDRIDELCERFRMGEFLERRCAGYSSGMRQKISISRAILQRPPVLLLDEATSNLDLEASNELVGVVERCSREGIVTVYTSHRISEIEKLCNKVLLVVRGRCLFWGNAVDFIGSGVETMESRYARMIEQSHLT